MLCVSVILLLIAVCSCNVMHSPIVDIEMSEAGFHRDLQYSVQFDYPLAGKDCEYALQQLLPAAVYVSVDQLDGFKRLEKLNAIYPKFVDIELPTEKAQPFSVLLKGTPKITDSLSLPIHFRYHAPKDQSSFVTVDIDNPSMYMRCPDDEDDLSDSELQATPSISYCLNEETSSFSEFSIDQSIGATTEECDWKLINANIRLKTPLSAQIPIGNEKAYPAILLVTIIVSWIVSLWTVFRTHTIPRRVNQKLEEQRILQNKIK